MIHAPSRRARKANRRVDGGSGGSEATFGPSEVETGEKTGDMARTMATVAAPSARRARPADAQTSSFATWLSEFYSYTLLLRSSGGRRRLRKWKKIKIAMSTIAKSGINGIVSHEDDASSDVVRPA